MTEPSWARRIQQRRAARIAALAAEEQTIRDAAAAQVPIKHIADALGQTNRQRIYDVLRRGRVEIGPPAAVPVVYLRATGRKPDLWTAVEQAMWLRGWRTEHDRTTAWHCSRGGTPVVLADFTLDQEVVCLVGARYGETDPTELLLPRHGQQIQPASKPRDTLPDRLAYAVAQVLDGLPGQSVYDPPTHDEPPAF